MDINDKIKLLCPLEILDENNNREEFCEMVEHHKAYSKEDFDTILDFYLMGYLHGKL